MRADPHDVEQLSSDRPAAQLRFVALSAIDEPVRELPDLDALTASIRSLGVLHPLLLAPERGHYRVIAGRRRFHAARAAGLTAVPCFVYDLPPEKAAALARADNLERTAAPETDPAGRAPRVAADTTSAFAHLSESFDSIAAAERLLATDGTGMAARVARDLIRAHAVRGAWMIGAVALVAGSLEPADHRQTLGTLMETLVADFAPESRVTGQTVRLRVDERAHLRRVNKQSFQIGLMAALYALSPFADAEHNCSLAITASHANESLTITIIQRATKLDARLARSFFDATWTTRPGGWAALLGALALKAAVEREGGSLTCETESSNAEIQVRLPDRA